jgi:hypothetical protein
VPRRRRLLVQPVEADASTVIGRRSVTESLSWAADVCQEPRGSIVTRVIRSRTGKIVAGGIAAFVLAGGGAAIAATEFGSPSARDSAIISDAATQLGVQPSALSSALAKAIDDEINAEVSAGRITQARADALEARVNAGQLPLLGGLGGGFRRGPAGGLGVGLSAAASYLGLTTAQLASDLRGGQTLAQIATAQGRTADGLVQALLSAEESNLDKAVAAGELTPTQEQSIESNLEQQITSRVNATRPGGFRGGFDRGRGFRGGGGPGFWRGGGTPGSSSTTTASA